MARLPSISAHRIRRSAGLATALAACVVVLVAPAAANATSYGWAKSGLKQSQRTGVMSATQVAHPAHVVTRADFITMLAQLETWRAAHGGAPAQLPTVATGTTLPDVADTTIFAKAVKLGWIAPIGGKFAGTTAITGDTSARAVLGAIGMQASARKFSAALRAATPGLSTSFEYRADQVYVRSLGMRYNNLQGTEQLEVGPNDPMLMAHVAYMLGVATTLDQWRVNGMSQYETFALPKLGPNQQAVIYQGVKLIGNPYIWAGETEGAQAEGHGGFDCSGFVTRVVLNGNVPATLRDNMGRTSMAMSAISKKRRITEKKLRPGDVIFFGYHGPKSKPAENYHTGVWLGNGWFIHSTGSNDGVSISHLDGYWEHNFSWGRRALHKA